MNKVYAFGENDDGTFTAMIDGCSNSILTRLINPSIPFVWSVNHFLGDSCTWGLRDTNLSKGGPVHKILVRNLSFDFFMNTAEYLACLSEFERQGNIQWILRLAIHSTPSPCPDPGGLLRSIHVP